MALIEDGKIDIGGSRVPLILAAAGVGAGLGLLYFIFHKAAPPAPAAATSADTTPLTTASPYPYDTSGLQSSIDTLQGQLSSQNSSFGASIAGLQAADTSAAQGQANRDAALSAQLVAQANAVSQQFAASTSRISSDAYSAKCISRDLRASYQNGIQSALDTARQSLDAITQQAGTIADATQQSAVTSAVSKANGEIGFNQTLAQGGLDAAITCH